MNTSGEVADMMVKEGIDLSDRAIRLAALGAKNLAAILIALLKDNEKLHGKTSLKQLLKSEKPLCILQIKNDDLVRFRKEAKRYGVLFTAIRDKGAGTGLCDIIARQEDVAKLNYIIEKLNITAPEIRMTDQQPEQADTAKEAAKAEPDKDNGDTKAKKPNPRTRENQSERRSERTRQTQRGDDNGGRESIRKRVNDIKDRSRAQSKGKTQSRSKGHKKSKSNKSKGR